MRKPASAQLNFHSMEFGKQRLSNSADRTGSSGNNPRHGVFSASAGKSKTEKRQWDAMEEPAPTP
jgi:hypothetical protein